MTDRVAHALTRVAASLPGGGESRTGQADMARAVSRAFAERRHLVVQAGTGTGKSLAYLVPAVLSGKKVVVATATKALQDQLASKDLPQVVAAVDEDLAFAVLKGRSNYLCRQRASEVGGRGDQLTLDAGADDPNAAVDRGDADDPGGASAPPVASADARTARTADQGRLADQVERLLQWAEDSPTGDRAELDFEPHARAWAMVSMPARDCPGAFRCPSGRRCFAEDARARAAEADVVVVNIHLYGAHLASGGAVLPPHDLVIFDEAHEVEDVMTDSLGVEIGPGRFRSLASGARSLLPRGSTAVEAVDSLAEVGDTLQVALRPLAGTRIPRHAIVATPVTGPSVTPATEPEDADPVATDPTQNGSTATLARATDTTRDSALARLADVLPLAAGRVRRLVDALRQAERDASDDEPAATQARRDRILLAAGHLADDLARVVALTDDEVAWVDEGNRTPTLRVSPIEVGPLLADRLWQDVTTVLTSATVPVGLPARLGLPADATDEIDVGSPFDYRSNALLYVARSLPDRRRPESEPALHDELATLITGAGGRTLALFTSWRAMTAAVDVLRERLPFPILAQSDLPKPALVEAFRADESTCLFATLGFWQGVDVAGRTLSLVTIDRIPFPRPDDPVLQARRDRAGSGAFGVVDLPRAGTLLAQGAGRLIRTSEDRGVVAVLDSRLATARYRGTLLARVPPMRRTVDRSDVEEFLASFLTPV